MKILISFSLLILFIGCGKDLEVRTRTSNIGSADVSYDGTYIGSSYYGASPDHESKILCIQSSDKKWSVHMWNKKDDKILDATYIDLVGLNPTELHNFDKSNRGVFIKVVINRFKETPQFDQIEERCTLNVEIKDGVHKGSFHCPNLKNTDGKSISVRGTFECKNGDLLF